MPQPPARRSAVQAPRTPAPTMPKTKAGTEAPTPVTPVAEKIAEGPGNLKAREAAYKRRGGVR